MRRIGLILIIVTLALGPSNAIAQLNLTTDDCGGAPVANWTCTSNTGLAFTLVASFTAPAGLRPIGQESILEFAFGYPVPAWWRIGSGECRAGTAIQIGYSSPPSGGCIDYFASVPGGATGSYEYLMGPLDPGDDRGGPLSLYGTRLIVRSSVDAAQAAQMDPPGTGDDIFLFSVGLTKSRTAGTDNCLGCTQPACVFVRSVRIDQPAPLGPWWASGMGGWPFMLQGGTYDCYVATNRSTWGQVKSLYR